MDANEKLGRLIQSTRQQRGLTQTQLAQMMHTSQSAINRIEHGKQNLSLETIKRFGHVLQQPFVNLNENKISLRIHGGQRLSGEVTIKSAKNATLGLMFMALLNHGQTILKQAARVEEIFRIIEVLESIGAQIRWQGNDLEIKRPARFDHSNINEDACKKTRSAMLLIGLLAAEEKQFSIPFTGGCRLGKRSIYGHAYALEELGVTIKTTKDCYQIKTQLHGSERPIVMYESSDTATINVLLAAAKLDGRTTIKLASANYQVQDICIFLRQLGFKIDGIGTTTLTITGQRQPITKNIVYYPSEDPVEAMTLITAAITTNSSLTIRRVPLDFLELELLKINKMGCQIDILKEYIGNNQYARLGDLVVHAHNGRMIALNDKISCRPYPGLNIDHLPYFVPIAATALGTTLIHDWVYENRAIYYTELNRIGADIQLADPHRVYVHGPTKWQPADLTCPPAIRPATINLLGMLAAEGISILRNIYTINRGYENIATTYNKLGAHIEIIKDI